MKKISLLDNFTQYFHKFFPNYCVVCKKEGQGRLCKNCKRKLKPHPEICPICHKKSDHGQVCLSCQVVYPNYPLKGIMILFSYDQIIKKLILSLKYYHIKDISLFLAERLANYITTNPLINLNHTGITYIPIHWIKKLFKKGYNQSYELAKNVAQILNLPLLDLCKKSKYTKSQLSLSRKQRLQNLKNSFQPINKMPENIKTIIIVDDLTTTGATLKEVATCIKQSNPHIDVWGLVVARHNI